MSLSDRGVMPPPTREYLDNYDAIFRKKPAPTPEQAPKGGVYVMDLGESPNRESPNKQPNIRN